MCKIIKGANYSVHTLILIDIIILCKIFVEKRKPAQMAPSKLLKNLSLSQ